MQGYGKENPFTLRQKDCFFRMPGNGLRYKSIPRDLEISFPYQQTAGFLACSFLNAVAFPIDQWPRFSRKTTYCCIQ
jgi:hypothetical protein